MFSHSIWRVLGWFIALAIAAGVALWIYKKQSYRALSYHVLSISPLMPLQARGFADLRVLKGDKPIERPFLTTIRIANTGDLNIAAADFAMPLTIRPIGSSYLLTGKELTEKFGISIFNIPYKGAAPFVPQVVDARVAATNPPKIPVEIDVSGPQLQIRPLLLNVGDDFTVEILINGDVRGIEVGGRIAGVKQITEEPREMLSPYLRKWSFWEIAASLFSVLLGFVISKVFFTYTPNRQRSGRHEP
jgi:hypothetical protein